jgi:fused signal recognition particle receptor
VFDIFNKFKEGLFKTSSKISQGLNDIFIKKKLDEENLERVRELLLATDLGVRPTDEVIAQLAKEKFDQEVSVEEIKEWLGRYFGNILQNTQGDLEVTNFPEIVVVCGVNGNGKTTTIGKLAYLYRKQGRKVLVAACDTFRAAAVEQLRVWSQRAEVEIVTGSLEADSASIAYQAVERAKQENYDVVLIDTAGRLHNKANLMEELSKINRVIKKIIPSAPHRNILVLDATTGQNAISQIQEFSKAIDINGIIVTKLDGTAKGGVVVAITKISKAKILAVGLGEKMEDLREFDSDSYAKNLIGIN